MVMLEYKKMPPSASMTPMSDLSAIARPLAIQPSETIKQVFAWPTTVLATAPAPATTKNWERLMRTAGGRRAG